MAFELPNHLHALHLTDSHGIAIAEIAIFGTVLLVQFSTRYAQEWRYWHYTFRKTVRRCYWISWLGLLGVFAKLRLVAFTLALAAPKSNEPILTTAAILQSVAVSPLIHEVAFILLRCGQAGCLTPGESNLPSVIRKALHASLIPTVIAIVLLIAGGVTRTLACLQAGCVMFAVSLIYLGGLSGWIVVKLRDNLNHSGLIGAKITILALPFLVVRLTYLFLAVLAGPRFSPLFGNWRIFVGMGLSMEVLVVSLFLTARAVAEPIWRKKDV